MRKSIRIAAILTPVVVVYTIVFSGRLTCILPDRYGVEFNSQRIKRDQPPIEDFFKEVPTKNCQAHSWVIGSDHDKSVNHIGKFYFTDGLGRLQYEMDYFRIEPDTNWIINNIQNLEGSPSIDGYPEAFELARTFYWANDSVTYSIDYRLKDRSNASSLLPYHTGDSIYSLYIWP